MANKIRIILARHAESEGNVDARAYVEKGDQNVSITEKGCTQSLAAGNFLSDYYKEQNVNSWPSVFISSYQRPQETFQGFYQGGLRDHFKGTPKLKEDVRLIEKFFGAASQMAFAEPEDYSTGFIDDMRRLSERTYKKDPFIASNVFGNSTLDSFSRAKNFIEGTLARDVKEGQREFLIVTHGAVIQSFIMAFAHLPMRSKPQVGNPNNCDLIAIEGEPKNWSITRIYNGEEMKADNRNIVKDIEYLTVDTLPPLPFPRPSGMK